MSDSDRTIQTDAGSLSVRDLSDDTLDQLCSFFPRVGWIEDQGRRLLALLPVHESRVLRGLRTGYGWYSPERREMAEGLLPTERLRIVEASRTFLSRTFRGVLMPAACLTGEKGMSSQLGELLFLRSSGRLERGLGNSSPIRGYEDEFGVDATDVLLSFVADICGAWKAAGVGKITVTDLEPCPANWNGMQWRADIILVDNKIVVVRPELVAEDPILSALARAGVSKIEHTPSVFLMQRPNATPLADS